MATRYFSAEGRLMDDYGGQFTREPGEFVYDGRTHATGAWACMTETSWALHGCGVLGIGCGQKYVRRENGELHKVEG